MKGDQIQAHKQKNSKMRFKKREEEKSKIKRHTVQSSTIQQTQYRTIQYSSTAQCSNTAQYSTVGIHQVAGILQVSRQRQNTILKFANNSFIVQCFCDIFSCSVKTQKGSLTLWLLNLRPSSQKHLAVSLSQTDLKQMFFKLTICFSFLARKVPIYLQKLSIFNTVKNLNFYFKNGKRCKKEFERINSREINLFSISKSCTVNKVSRIQQIYCLINEK